MPWRRLQYIHIYIAITSFNSMEFFYTLSSIPMYNFIFKNGKKTQKYFPSYGFNQTIAH